jgi:hypothetical protein
MVNTGAQAGDVRCIPWLARRSIEPRRVFRDEQNGRSERDDELRDPPDWVLGRENEELTN